MLKGLLSLLLIFSGLLGATVPQSTIESVNEEYATTTISGAHEKMVGMNGIIVHSFDATTSTISAYGKIVKVEGEKVTLQLSSFDTLTQPALPSINIAVEKGDIYRIGYNYSRVMIIAPNYEAYQSEAEKHSRVTLSHPDLFAALLSSRGHTSPQSEDFRFFCQQNSIGKLLFVLKDGVKHVDCINFETIKNEQNTKEHSTIQLPFYTRIKKINSSWFGAGSDDIEEYDKYYETLLKKKKTSSKSFLNSIFN